MSKSKVLEVLAEHKETGRQRFRVGEDFLQAMRVEAMRASEPFLYEDNSGHGDRKLTIVDFDMSLSMRGDGELAARALVDGIGGGVKEIINPYEVEEKQLNEGVFDGRYHGERSTMYILRGVDQASLRALAIARLHTMTLSREGPIFVTAYTQGTEDRMRAKMDEGMWSFFDGFDPEGPNGNYGLTNLREAMMGVSDVPLADNHDTDIATTRREAIPQRHRGFKGPMPYKLTGDLVATLEATGMVPEGLYIESKQVVDAHHSNPTIVGEIGVVDQRRAEANGGFVPLFNIRETGLAHFVGGYTGGTNYMRVNPRTFCLAYNQAKTQVLRNAKLTAQEGRD